MRDRAGVLAVRFLTVFLLAAVLFPFRSVRAVLFVEEGGDRSLVRGSAFR